MHHEKSLSELIKEHDKFWNDLAKHYDVKVSKN